MSTLNQFILDFTPKVASRGPEVEERPPVTLDSIFSDRTHADRVRPYHMLQLSPTSENALARGGILSTGGAYDALKSGKLEAKEFGNKLKHELAEHFEFLEDYLDQDSARIRWVKFAHDPRVGVKNLCFTGPEISRLHPEDATKDISSLHFNRAQNTLKREGWDTIGKLFSALEMGIRDVKTFGKSAQRELADRALALSFSIDSQGNIDWLAFAEKLELDVLPAKAQWKGGNEQLLKLFPELVRQTVELSGKKMELDAFEARLMQPRDSRPTLEEIGERFDVTRERIRQLEVLAVDRVQRALFEENYDQSSFRFRPELRTLFRRAKRHFWEFGDRIWKAEDWLHELSELWECKTKVIADHMTLFTEVLGFDEYLPKRGNAGLIVFPDSLTKAQRQQKLKQVAALEKSLREWPLPTPREVAVESANRLLEESHAIDEAELDYLLTLSGDILVDEESGNLEIDFADLKLGAQALRIVVENGEPLHLSEIEKRISEKGGISVNRIGAHLGRQEGLVAIGRTGNWAHTEWNLETGTIAEVAEDILKKAGEALSEKMLRNLIQKKRPLSEAAVPMVLEQKPDIFVELGPRLWGLKEWGDEATPSLGHWTYDALTAFIEEVFNDEASATVPFLTLRERLQEASDYSHQKAAGMLRSHPRLDLSGPVRNRVARFLSVAEAEKKARAEAKKERKPVRRGKNWKAIHHWLNQRFDDLEGEATPLNEIVKGVEAELSIARHITYGVISQSDEFETFTLEDSPIKLCRRPGEEEEAPALEEVTPGVEIEEKPPVVEPTEETVAAPEVPTVDTTTFPGANRIQNEIEKLRYDKWKDELVRGKGLMSPDTVDFALICAGRVFDDALRVLVEIAKKKDVVPVDSYRDDRDLKSRIDWAVRCRLFEDSEQLHLLRKERNQHAHNIAGPERERIWRSAPLLFSEYVRSIHQIESHLARFLGYQAAS